MHKGTELGAVSTMGEDLTDAEYIMNPMTKFVLQMVKDQISPKVITRRRMTKHCKGVIDEMITDVLKMKEMVTRGELLFQCEWQNNTTNDNTGHFEKEIDSADEDLEGMIIDSIPVINVNDYAVKFKFNNVYHYLPGARVFDTRSDKIVTKPALFRV